MFRQDFFYGPRNATEEMRSIFEVLIRAVRGVFFYISQKGADFLSASSFGYMIFLHILQGGFYVPRNRHGFAIRGSAMPFADVLSANCW